VNNPEADYYRLRTEWLRYKSQLHDSLTGLPALAAVVDEVRKLLESHRSVEVLYLDLGRSGWHETELGWADYDGLVREFARALRGSRETGLLGPEDLVCLYTVRSDRFVVFLAGGERGFSAHARRERLLLGLRDAMKTAPELLALRSVRVSAGHARIVEHPMTRAERVVQSGVAEASLKSLMEREGSDAARHEALHDLINRATVRPVFHPILRLADGGLVGHEALTRADFQGAFESVEDLFAFAESTDRVVDFERVCRRSAIRSAARLPHGRLFLNTSAPAILDPDWLEGETPGLLRSIGLRPDEVVVEVTERLAVTHQEGFETGLRALKERGYRVAVDDMGAGYASLQTLAAVEPDFLKFDTRLVRDIDRSSIKRSLLDTLRVLADKIHARVIAEGIEREEERDTLIGLGIELPQGFLFSREESA